MKLAFIVPRFGPTIRGGAEQLGYGLAQSLAANGHEVQIWTTCVEDHLTWKNLYPPGRSEIDGMEVHRFTVEQPDQQLTTLSQKLHVNGFLPVPEQYEWLMAGPHSIGLYEHVAKQVTQVDKVIAMPYISSLVQYSMWIAPERTILIPCLHNELYAYMEWMALSAESVFGIMFNTEEEQDLAIHKLRIGPIRHSVVGAGIMPNAIFNLPVNQNQLLYIGRLEPGKNVRQLYDYVSRFVEEGNDLQLHVIGVGPLKPPDHPAFVYHGSASEEKKLALCAESVALCQPSTNESFAIVLMESWDQGRPVLVHGECDVTRGHVKRCQGGLWFENYEEFAETIKCFQANPTLATQMGQNGHEYVQQNYTWTAIAQRFEDVLTTWQKE